MKQAVGGTEFIIIGENIHCSRIVKREGIRGGVAPDGRPGVRFPDGDGESWVPLPDSILESKEFTGSQRIKHVMAAVRQGLAGGEAADSAARYVAWMAERQIAGAALISAGSRRPARTANPPITASSVPRSRRIERR